MRKVRAQCFAICDFLVINKNDAAAQHSHDVIIMVLVSLRRQPRHDKRPACRFCGFAGAEQSVDARAPRNFGAHRRKWGIRGPWLGACLALSCLSQYLVRSVFESYGEDKTRTFSRRLGSWYRDGWTIDNNLSVERVGRAAKEFSMLLLDREQIRFFVRKAEAQRVARAPRIKLPLLPVNPSSCLYIVHAPNASAFAQFAACRIGTRSVSCF